MVLQLSLGEILRPQSKPPRLEHCLVCDQEFDEGELKYFAALCRLCEQNQLRDLAGWRIEKREDAPWNSEQRFLEYRAKLGVSQLPSATILGCRQCSPQKDRNLPLCVDEDFLEFCLTCSLCFCSYCSEDHLENGHDTLALSKSTFLETYNSLIDDNWRLEHHEANPLTKTHIQHFACWFMRQAEEEIPNKNGKAALYFRSVQYGHNTRNSFVSPFSIAQSEKIAAYTDLQSLSVKVRKIFRDPETNTTTEIRQKDIFNRITENMFDVENPGEAVCIPTCVFLDNSNIYVLYGHQSMVKVYSEDGEFVMDVGGDELSDDCLSVAVINGRIIVADRGKQCIQQFSIKGNFIKRIGALDFKFSFFPNALAVDKDKHELYVLDSFANRIYIFIFDLNSDLTLLPKEFKVPVDNAKSLAISGEDVILASPCSARLLFINKYAVDAAWEMRGPMFYSLFGVSLHGDSLLTCSLEGRISNLSLKKLKKPQ